MAPQGGQMPKKPTMSTAQGGLSPMLNQVMGTPEKKSIVGNMGQPDIQQPFSIMGERDAQQPLIGRMGQPDAQPPMFGRMGQPDIEQPMIGNMGQPDVQQPMFGKMGQPDIEQPLIGRMGQPDAQPQAPFRSSQGLLLTPQQQQSQAQFPMGQPQQPPTPPQQGAAPQLIGNEQWQEAIKRIGQIKPFEPSAQLPTQEKIGGFANRMFEEQLGLLSGSVDRKHAQEKEQLQQAMADRGIPVGSEAYAREQYTLAERQAAENAQLRAQAMQFGQQAASQEYARALDTYRTGMEEAQLRSNLASQPLQQLSPLAQTQYGAGEQRFLQGQQIGYQERLTGAELASREKIAADSIASEERRLGRSLTSQEKQQITDIAAKKELQQSEFVARKEEQAALLESNKWLAGFDRDTQTELLRQKQTGELDIAKFDAATRESLLMKQIEGNERLQGLSSQTQRDLAKMEIEGRINLQQLSGQQQQELLDRETAKDKDLALLGRETQLQLLGRQFENDMAAKQFDATTQRDLLKMNLDQQDKQFAASMDMEEKRFFQQQYEFNKNLGLNEKQLEASTQIQLKQLQENRRQFDKNMLRTIQQDKFLNKLQRDQLAELISSGKRDDATKRYIANRAASGNALSADEQGNIASSRANGAIQGTIDAINAQVAAGIITPAQRDRAVQNALGVKGSGGVSLSMGGK